MDGDIKLSWKIYCNIFIMCVGTHGCTTKLDLWFLVITITWEMLQFYDHCVYSTNTNHYRRPKYPATKSFLSGALVNRRLDGAENNLNSILAGDIAISPIS